MITLSLLMITITGIAAIPYEKSLQSNINVNRIDSELESLDRIKRSADNWVTIRGDQYQFTYNQPDSNYNVLHILNSLEPMFYYNKFRLTNDLNYTTWEQLLSDHTYADFNAKIHIEFHRNDQKGTVHDVRVFPETIPLKKISKGYEDVEQHYTGKVEFMTMLAPASVTQIKVQQFRDLPFSDYQQKIFDESIYVGATRINVKIDMTLEGFKKDNELILQLVFKVTQSDWFTTSGLYVKVNGYNELVLK